MIKIEFSEEAKAALQYERFHHPHPRVQMKMEALWLKSQGMEHQEITKLVGSLVILGASSVVPQRPLNPTILGAVKLGGIRSHL